MSVKATALLELDIQKIIDEIGQPNIKVILYFFSPSFEKSGIHIALQNAFPSANVFGASMTGGWSSKGAVKTGITIMSLSADEVEECYFSFQEGVKEYPVESARNAIAELKQQTKGLKINSDEYLGLIFFDGLCLGELIIKEFSLERDLNMAFVGGAAADEMTFTGTYVSAGNRISNDGLAAIILKMNIPFFFNHYVHYLPTEKSFTITRVEIMQRIAWEINGEPAAEFYAKQIGLKDASMLTNEIFAQNPLGLILGDSVYIRSPNIVVDGKGLQFYCYIEAGTTVFLLKQGDIIANAKKSITGAKQFLPGIQGCLLFNCVQRHLELIKKNLVNDFNDVFSKYPMIGFNTYGEELFTHHNQTLTAVFFGNLPEEGMLDPHKTKRLFHYTDSKLKSLVFDIVSRSELLNITISYLKGSVDAQTDETAIANYETIRMSLGAMIEQSNVSKEDIYRMLIVYQNNVEKTGEYVFRIVDEINAQNQQLVELREEAEHTNRTKSNFLASMSHEIRTPINAITGMAELLLRSELTNEARGYALDIKQAGNNLIMIVNDILDFSKIDAGRMEIFPEKYFLASLINDTVNIIRMRIKEKPIRFITNIDGNIPQCLIGDEVRLRQILINLLSNAAKFTDKGSISLSITIRQREENKIWLDISVKDTGHGIKTEDKNKLFSEFVQINSKRDRNVEGTGLGLVITQRLCRLMGGNISVESEYGKGSMFTVTIPQEIDHVISNPFAVVENPKDLNVLVYERRAVYAESVCWSLENMGVPYTMVTAIDDFAKTLKKEQWSYIISGYGLYDKIKKVMNMPKEEYPGEKIPPLALLVEWDSEAFVPNVRLTSLPIQTLSIANILTGKTDVKVYSDTSGGVIRYSFPNARMLVVDDIYTNLKVAEGLLAPYHCIVDTCLSGQEAIEMVKHFKYDIIFMDHMMPDMDGIETTVMIREWEKEILLADEEHLKENKKQLPIIALTANAVSGVREMLIKKGFSDFIAKPIDLSKLDEVINRWVSKEKRNNSKIKSSHSAGSEKIDHHSIKIDGIEIYKGMKMTGGTKDRFFSVLSLFCKDAQKRLDILRQPIKEETDVKTFEINIHAIKSAAAAIGAEELFSEAFRLENACRVGDKEYILNNRDLFADQLSKLIEGINFALGSEKEENVKTSVQDFDNLDSKMQVISLLIELEKALISQKAEDIDNLLTEINKQQMDDKTKEAMEVITDDVLMTEFGKAIKTVNECMTNLI